MVAGRWTLLDRSARELLSQCEERGISVVAAAPFNSGLLARPWPSDDAHFDYAPAPAAVIEAARKAAEACIDSGTTLPHAAMQFPLHHSAVACVVAGIRTAAQATQNVSWATSELPDGLLSDIERCMAG
jgi:D-threo-aldose 1-dehydrogenase